MVSGLFISRSRPSSYAFLFRSRFCIHSCRLVKNIGGNNQNCRKTVSITDEIIGASQLLGAHALATNNSVMKSIINIIVIFNIIIVVLLLLFYYYYYFYYYYFTCVVVEVRRGS